MSQAKSTVLFGWCNDVEAAYGGGGTVDEAVDAIKLMEEVVGDLEYGHDGDRGESGTSYPEARGVPSARFMNVSPPFIARGAGSAYSASVFPEVMRVARMCGWSSTLVTTSGSESYTFAMDPVSTAAEGGFGKLYARGHSYAYSAGLGSLNYVIDAAGYMVFRPDLSLRVDSVPATEALPSLTHQSGQHPKAVGMALTLGDFNAPVWKRIEFNQNRVIAPRLSGNQSQGHAGFARGRHVPTFTVDFEAAALVGSPYHSASGIDPWNMYEAATQISISFTYGSTQYNRCTHTLSQCQLAEPPREPADGPTGLFRLVFQVNNATSFVFN